MRHFPVKWIWILAASTVVCAACESMGNPGLGPTTGGTKMIETTGDLGDLSRHYGDENAVRVTIGTIKMQGMPVALRETPPSTRDATGSTDALVGRVRTDPSHERGLLLWIATDGLCLTASNVVKLAEARLRVN